MMEEQEIFNQEPERAVLSAVIPPCPGILVELSAEARKDELDYRKIENLICADVGLSTSLIKTINSPFYGLRNKVHSVMQAIHVLGLPALSQMVMGMVLRNTLKGISRVDMGRFWDASAKVAIISSYIACKLPYLPSFRARQLCKIDKDKAYTFGLFQDCGIPILMNTYPTQYKETLGIANQSANKKFTAIEDEACGKNHAAIGYLLAKNWGLPEAMANAIRFHHEHDRMAEQQNSLSTDSRNFVALALLAERCIQAITGLNQTIEWEKGGAWVLEHFGFSDADFNEIVEGIRVLKEEGSLN